MTAASTLITRNLGGRRTRQRGAMMVDLLVTITVTGIVMTAVFPIFLVLYRSEIAFNRQTQATSAGMVAEDTLLKDIRSLDVSATGDNTLTLSAFAAGGGTTYNVQYSVDANHNALVRTVTDQSGTQIRRSVIAHYVNSFTSSCSGNPALIQVSMSVTGSQGQSVQLKPDLSFTPRNQQGCP